MRQRRTPRAQVIHCVESSKLVYGGILSFHSPLKISFFFCGLINCESKVGRRETSLPLFSSSLSDEQIVVVVVVDVI